MNKTTALRLIKRKFGHGRDHQSDHRVFLAEHDGRLWATNSYWLAPAEWFAIVLPERDEETYNWTPGTYDAKSGEKVSDGCPEIGRLFPAKDALRPLEPVEMHGAAVVLASVQGDLSLFTFGQEDGPISKTEDAAFNRAFVDMFRDGAGSAAVVLHGQDPLKPAMVYKATSYTKADYSKVEGLELIGLIMPVRMAS